MTQIGKVRGVAMDVVGFRRRVAVASAVVALAVTGVACEPTPPPEVTQLTVTSTGGGGDAVPGDGVCETVVGGGECTLPAAVDEANALGAAAIALPAGVYDTPDLSITGDVSITGDPQGTQFVYQEIRVEAGASLELDGAFTGDIPGARLVVAGYLLARNVDFVVIESIWPALEVLPGGQAVVYGGLFVQVLFPGVPAVRNAGHLTLVHSAVHSVDEDPATGAVLDNTGTVVSAASVITRCSGAAPVSLGSNASWDESCGWTGPGDLETSNLGFDLILSNPLRYLPRADSPLVDAIPVGTFGCGGGDTDLMGTVRGVDGNGDGTAGCDIGAIERPAP